MGKLIIIPIIILFVFFAVYVMRCQSYFVHILQLEGYKNKGYFHWFSENFKRIIKPLAIIGIVLLLVYLFLSNKILIFSALHIPPTVGKVLSIVIFWLAMVFSIISVIKYHKICKMKDAKKPLVFTTRVKRLYACIIILVAIAALLQWIFKKSCVYLLVIVLLPLLAPFANLLMNPIEICIKRHFFNDAKRKIAARTDLLKIGITGSYGKTSVKFVLGTILQQKFDTLVPPQSYNTPMGLTRVIREQMTDKNQVFIAEMGAKNIGDIKELVGLVHPQIAILTSIGPQHLETFKNMQNIIDTKYELIEGLSKSSGVAFFNGDNDYCRKLYEQTDVHKKVLYTMDMDGDVRATDISASCIGSTFTITAKEGVFSCETKLLGRHNILNICGCIAVALELGLTIDEIKTGVASLQPIEHRLQIVPTDNGITVIDDAFNANPQGVLAALEVLSCFSGQRFIITPGLVELGQSEEQENFKFGQAMAKVATYAFLIGPKHSKPIYDGLVSEGFLRDNIYVAKTLNEATTVMTHLTKVGDVILFENDLPDNYNEE
ncbi:MAG: UDP-N-acetylmuramoyl-tripeptide--D-alanyl-D-alanine ligase [Christensenellaceae bacterium]